MLYFICYLNENITYTYFATSIAANILYIYKIFSPKIKVKQNEIFFNNNNNIFYYSYNYLK